MLKHATRDELFLMLELVLDSESTTSLQADLMFAVVDELTERGELSKTTEDETSAALKEMLRKANDREAEPLPDGAEPEWASKLRADMLQDQARAKTRRRTVRNAVISAASVITILFLSNFAAIASGYDLFGAVSQWTKDAIRVFDGTGAVNEPPKAETVELDALKLRLSELNAAVDLPSVVPEGFRFDTLEAAQSDDPKLIVAWFSNADSFFSIKILWIGAGEGSFFEADGSEHTENYSNKHGRFILSSNFDRNVIIWYQDGYELQIQGDITKEDLIKMVDSIGR